jgi:hypothetical protein
MAVSEALSSGAEVSGAASRPMLVSSPVDPSLPGEVELSLPQPPMPVASAMAAPKAAQTVDRPTL